MTKKDYRKYLTTPYETHIKNFTIIAKFFMYYAPEIDTAQSPGRFEENQADQMINNMFDSAGLSKNAHKLNKIQSKSWGKYDLDGYMINFESPKILCNKYGNESDLHALLRHIRNALAHGYLYIYRKNNNCNYIMLIDFDSKTASNGEKKITSKILVSMHILEAWKAILENQIALGE